MPDAQIAAPSAAVESQAEVAKPEIVSAVDQAVADDNVAAFKAARLAEKSGKPLDAAPADSSSAETKAADSSPADPVKRADKRATENRVPELLAERAALRDRADRLERELNDLRAKPPVKDERKADSSPAAAATFPSYDQYLVDHADASYEQYIAAHTRHVIAEELKADRDKAASEARFQRELHTVKERNVSFRKQVDAAVKEQADFLETLSEDVLALRPFSSIRDAKGQWTEQPTGYHAVADELMSSPIAPRFMRHFTDHPEDLHRIAQLPPPQLLKEMGKLEFRLTDGKSETKPVTKPITEAPRPPTTLGARSESNASATDAAVASGDVAAYRAARLREKTANLR